MNPLHYPSLELCKELTQAKFPETEKAYVTLKTPYGDWENTITLYELAKKSVYCHYVCPSVSELLDKMPKNISYLNIENSKVEIFSIVIHGNGAEYMVAYKCSSCQLFNFYGNLPNALSDMYILLKENNLLPK